MKSLVLVCILLFYNCYAAFNYSDLQRLIQYKQLTSIEAVLSELPEEFKTNYVLLKKSSAFQVASLERPRIILYNDVMTLTIATDENHPTYYEMEVLNYLPEQNEYELHVIDFKNNSVRYSEKNPQTCTACHGHNPKPLWEDHMNWSHAFMPHSNSLSEEELSALKNYVLVSHPRTQVFLNDNKDWITYTESINPALHLTQHYSEQYAQHIARKIIENPAHIQFPEVSFKIMNYSNLSSYDQKNLEHEILIALEKIYPNDFQLLFDQYSTTNPDYSYSILRSMFYEGPNYYSDILSLSFIDKFELDYYDGSRNLLDRILELIRFKLPHNHVDNPLKQQLF